MYVSFLSFLSPSATPLPPSNLSSSSSFTPQTFSSPLPSSVPSLPSISPAPFVPSAPISTGAPLAIHNPLSITSQIASPYSSAAPHLTPPPPLSSPPGPVLSAPPTGPPISGFSITASYDITKGHAGRAPQTPLMPSFSAPPVTGKIVF